MQKHHAKQEVADLFSPCGQTNTQVLKVLPLPCKMDRPWRGLSNHIKWWLCLQK